MIHDTIEAERVERARKMLSDWVSSLPDRDDIGLTTVLYREGEVRFFLEGLVDEHAVNLYLDVRPVEVHGEVHFKVRHSVIGTGFDSIIHAESTHPDNGDIIAVFAGSMDIWKHKMRQIKPCRFWIWKDPTVERIVHASLYATPQAGLQDSIEGLEGEPVHDRAIFDSLVEGMGK